MARDYLSEIYLIERPDHKNHYHEQILFLDIFVGWHLSIRPVDRCVHTCMCDIGSFFKCDLVTVEIVLFVVSGIYKYGINYILYTLFYSK